MAALSPNIKKRRRREKMVAANAPAYNDYHVPHDVVIGIISKLPLKSQIRFSCVSRFWFNSIQDHFLQYSRNIIPRKIEALAILWNSKLVGSCNGLVCFHRVCSYPEIVLYSSSGKPCDKLTFRYGTTKGLGFGFDPMTREHKVVRIFFDDKSSSMQCMVFILNTGTMKQLWRKVTIKINQSWSWSLVPWGKPRTFELAAIPWEEALCWRTENSREMIVFHLDNYKFQLIQEED